VSKLYTKQNQMYEGTVAPPERTSSGAALVLLKALLNALLKALRPREGREDNAG